MEKSKTHKKRKQRVGIFPEKKFLELKNHPPYLVVNLATKTISYC